MSKPLGSDGAEPHDTVPGGVPIARSLHLPERLLYPDLYEAARSIDQVHGDGQLPVIPVLPLDGVDSRGRFVERLGAPSAILINAQARDRGFALLHEVGHFLDFAGLGTPGEYTSGSGDADMASWRQATERSDAVRQLASLVDELEVTQPTEERRRHRRRVLLDPEELWARSYAQYVTRRSGNPALVAALDRLRTPNPGVVYYPMQWSEADFRPIDEAIEELFRRIGWRSQRPTRPGKPRSAP
jgi:hypothetical protein